MKFQDYYATLEVSRTASADEIQRAYRKLARKFHPDVNKEAGAEDKFKKLSEAYEVLKDPEKRKLYDALGENWKAGQDFQPPPGWSGGAQRGYHSAGGAQFSFGGDFSDFFQAVFGGGGFSIEDLIHESRGAGSFGTRTRSMSPRAVQAELPLTVRELVNGGSKQISFDLVGRDGKPLRRTLNVKIPKAITDGGTMRLAGQGGEGPDGPLDLLLTVRVVGDDRFRIEGDAVVVTLPLAPWEAALGGKLSVELPDGAIMLTIPSGAQHGQRVRVRGRGLPQRVGGRSDALVEFAVVVPRELSPRERELFEALKAASGFEPRR